MLISAFTNALLKSQDVFFNIGKCTELTWTTVLRLIQKCIVHSC